MKRYFLGLCVLTSLGFGYIGIAYANERNIQATKQNEIQTSEAVKWIDPGILKKLQSIKPAKFDMLPLKTAFAELADNGKAVKGWSDGGTFESAVKTDVEGMLKQFNNGQESTLNGFNGSEAIIIFRAKRQDGVAVEIAATADGKVIARQLSGPKELIVPPFIMQVDPNQVYIDR